MATAPLSLSDGTAGVRLARDSAAAAVLGKPLPGAPPSPRFREPRGAFVTLRREDVLRGCIGRAEPAQPLGEAIVESAAAAATRDPRFEPVAPDELGSLSLEVTVLSPPEPLAGPAPELVKRVAVGEHGLMVRRGNRAGLLLPQVPVEQGWDSEEFLCQVCAKAGLPMDAWLLSGTRLFAFRGQIFAERGPAGPVEEVRLENGRGPRGR